jgi:hypothetical protein
MFLVDERADRHLDVEILAGLPGLVRALAMTAAARFELGMKAEVDERVLAGSGDDVDGAAGAAIATVGPAAWNVLLATEAEGASSSVARGYVDVHLIDEHKDQYKVAGAGCQVPAGGRCHQVSEVSRRQVAGVSRVRGEQVSGSGFF